MYVYACMHAQTYVCMCPWCCIWSLLHPAHITLYNDSTHSWPTPTLPAVLDALIPPGSDTNPPLQAPGSSLYNNIISLHIVIYISRLTHKHQQPKTVRLGAASLLHLARAGVPALAPGKAGDRARDLVAAILRRVIEGRVLFAYASKQQEGPSPALVALQVRVYNIYITCVCGFIYTCTWIISAHSHSHTSQNIPNH